MHKPKKITPILLVTKMDPHTLKRQDKFFPNKIQYKGEN